MLSSTEENYLKQIVSSIQEQTKTNGVGTNELAQALAVKPSTVNTMIKKLKEKGLITNEKYGKIFLTKEGKKQGINIIRKHRLWETFLYEKLDFSWDEIHEVAEQLEHIKSDKLIEKLDKFLSFPAFDPHGDPIPNKKGEVQKRNKLLLSEVPINTKCTLVSVKDSSAVFLKYVQKIGLTLNNKFKVLSKLSFDDSLELEINDKKVRVSNKFALNIFVVINE